MMHMQELKYKNTLILFNLLSCLVLFFSFYLEYVKALHPCPLCIMQRFCVVLLLFIGLNGIWAPIWLKKILAILQIVVASSGLIFASRQIWLQYFAQAQHAACMPELDILIRYFSWHDILQSFLWGTTNCSSIEWAWLGLSIPAWAGLYFTCMFLYSCFFFYQVFYQNMA